MVNEFLPYGTGITFKQKWFRKYWTLTIIKHMETREIHINVIELNNWPINEQSLKYKP